MDELLADEEEDGGRRSGGAPLEALDSAFQACFERGLVSQAAQVCVSCEEDARACDVGYPSLNHVHAAGEGTFHAWYEESREACRRELLGTSAPSTCPAPLVAAFGRCMDFFDNSSLPDPDWEGLFDFCAAGGHGEMYFSICLHDYQPTPCWAIATDMDRIQTWIDERSELCRAPVLGADS